MIPRKSQEISTGPIFAVGSTFVVGTNAGDVSTSRSPIIASPEEPFTKVKKPVGHFSGRKSQLAEIKDAFRKSHMVVVTGLCGIGKTELARKFCEQEENNYGYVVWLDCATPEVLTNSLESLAQKNGIETSNRDGLYELIMKKTSLFVFDDAEEWVLEYLPRAAFLGSKTPDIVITSTWKTWKTDTVFDKLSFLPTVMELKGFSITEAVCFIEENLKLGGDNDESIKILAQKLNCYPPLLRRFCKLFLLQNSSLQRNGGSNQVADFLLQFKNNIHCLDTVGMLDKVVGRISKSPFSTEIMRVIHFASYFKSNVIREDLLIKISPTFPKFCGETEKYFLTQRRGDEVVIEPLVVLLSQINLKKTNEEETMMKLLAGRIIDGWSDGMDSNDFLELAVQWCSLDFVKYLIVGKEAVVTVDFVCLAIKMGDLCFLKFLLAVPTVPFSGVGRCGASPLHYACEKGLIDIVKRLLDVKNVNESAHDLRQMTAVHYAARAGHINIFKFLVDGRNGDPGAKDVDGMNAMHHASKEGHIDIVEYLFDANWKWRLVVEEKDGNGMNAAHHASKGGHIDIVKYLFDGRKWNPAEKDGNGMNVVHHAAESGHLNVVRYLCVSTKVNPAEKDAQGMNAVHHASKEGHMDVVKCLVDSRIVNPNGKDSTGMNAAHHAVKGGHIDIVEYLLGKKLVDPAVGDKTGKKLIHYAASGGYLDIIKYLIDDLRLDYIDECCNGRMTTIALAAKAGHLHIVKFLVEEKEIDATRTVCCERAAFFHAAEAGHFGIVKYLIEHTNVDPALGDKLGMNVVHYACKSGNIGLVKFLVDERHVNPAAEDNSGMNSIDHAATVGHIELIKYLLLNTKVDFSKSRLLNLLHIAVKGCHVETVKFLVDEKNVDPHAKDAFGRTAIHNAAEVGQLDIIKFLVEEKCADIEARSRFGANALHYAARRGHIEVVKYLVGKKKMDPAVLDGDGLNAVRNAIDDGHIVVIKYLLEENEQIDLAAKDQYGMNYLHYAVRPGWLGTVQFLVEKLSVDTGIEDSKGRTAFQFAKEIGREEIASYLLPLTRNRVE